MNLNRDMLLATTTTTNWYRRGKCAIHLKWCKHTHMPIRKDDEGQHAANLIFSSRCSLSNIYLMHVPHSLSQQYIFIWILHRIDVRLFFSHLHTQYHIYDARTIVNCVEKTKTKQIIFQAFCYNEDCEWLTCVLFHAKFNWTFHSERLHLLQSSWLHCKLKQILFRKF